MRWKIFSRRGLRGKRWYFRGIARNGEPVCQSEGYKNRADAEATVALIRSEAGISPPPEIEE